MFDNLVFRPQNYFARYFAPFRSLCVLSCVEQREKVDFPGHGAALLNQWLHVRKLNSVVELFSVYSKFRFCLKSLVTLWTRHFERSHEVATLICIDLSLPSVVLTVFLLFHFVIECFTVFFIQLFADKADGACLALELALAEIRISPV